mgnify:CR=1 FL=1
MLLVDDHIAKVGKLHLVLDKGVCTDEDVYIARGDALNRGATLTRLGGTREYRHTNAYALRKARHRGVVLARKNLGRCHNTRLKAIIDSQEHRHKRHHSLAAANVALQQAIHLASRQHIATNLLDYALLCRGQAKR